MMKTKKNNLKKRNLRQLLFKIVSTGIFGVVLLMTNSCNSGDPVYTESLKFDSKLSDGKKLEMNYEIIFEKENSGSDLEKAMDKITYALNLVFSKVHSKELVKDGERKARNSLLVILRRHFSKGVIDVRVTSLTINSKSITP